MAGLKVDSKVDLKAWILAVVSDVMLVDETAEYLADQLVVLLVGSKVFLLAGKKA